MLTTGLKIGSALLLIAAIPAVSGCANCRAGTRVTTVSSKCNLCGKRACHGGCETTAMAPKVSLTNLPDLPPNAKPGECYAKIFIPPQFETRTEQVCVHEASERLEIIPAEYEWVDQKVLVKECSTELVEVPAQFDTQDRIVQTSPGYTTWTKEPQARCVADTNDLNSPPPQDVFCLVSAPPTTTTVQAECMTKPATVQEVTIPAEYQTIRVQKVLHPATTRRVPIPAEFQDVEKTVMVSPGRMEWQRVDCDIQAQTEHAEFGMDRQVRPVRDTNVDYNTNDRAFDQKLNNDNLNPDLHEDEDLDDLNHVDEPGAPNPD